MFFLFVYFVFVVFFCIKYRGGSSGGRARRAPPLKWEKYIIFWRKIVIFHTKYPKNVRASLRSAQFFKVRPLT